MRNLPKKRSKRQKLIITACLDYFGAGASVEDKSKAKKIALWVMGRRKGNKLTEEDFDAVWRIRQNLSDGVYQNSLERFF